ncbi:MAG: hypothetical protein ACD_12C00770G0001 [uncultured bacterium]|nr:MAG: hypothetical protein ACD_12C00770G0001 [uncultured bacterium]
MAQYDTIAADTITFNDLLTPNIGISTVVSANFKVSSVIPDVSLPKIKATGPE